LAIMKCKWVLCVSQFLPKVRVEADLLSQFEEEALFVIYLVFLFADDVNIYNNFINNKLLIFPIRWDEDEVGSCQLALTSEFCE
jgi:hypothetical protein